MARWKLWVVVALALGTGVASLAVGSAGWAARQLEQVDHSLAAARAQAELSQAALLRQVEAVALLAARDPALLAALGEPAAPPAKGKRKARRPVARPDPSGVADAAVKAAAQALRVDFSHGLVSALATDGWPGKDPAHALVEAALGGSARRGHVRYGDKVFAAAAVPVRQGTALLFGVPIDLKWTEALRADTSVRAVLFSGPGKAAAPLPAGEAKAFAAVASKPGGAPVSVGKLGKVKPPDAGFLPPLPLLFVQAPAQRVQAVALAGLPGAALVLAAPTAPVLAPLGSWQQLGAAALLVVLLAAVAFTAFSGGAGRWPPELLAAADRMAQGDFEARVPRLPGQAGRVGAALNRAAEVAAGRGAPGAAPEAVPEAAPEAVREAVPEAAPEAAPEATAEAAPEATAEAAPEAAPEAASEAPPETAPERAYAPAPEAAPVPVAGSLAAAEPRAAAGAPAGPIPALASTGRLAPSELFMQTSAAPPGLAPLTRTARFEAATPAAAPSPPSTFEEDEEHWRQVFQDFVKVREQCGEPTAGLTYERLRQKLQKNKENLVAKYSCRAVRFQVYVREGKAALKATPVR